MTNKDNAFEGIAKGQPNFLLNDDYRKIDSLKDFKP